GRLLSSRAYFLFRLMTLIKEFIPEKSPTIFQYYTPLDGKALVVISTSVVLRAWPFSIHSNPRAR
ncbi:MAG: hypothetical protein M3R50_02015, partial [Bacteroidota bacterium]|nr:hypothetical protein [Bacteroidota bacterium]